MISMVEKNVRNKNVMIYKGNIYDILVFVFKGQPAKEARYTNKLRYIRNELTSRKCYSKNGG